MRTCRDCVHVNMCVKGFASVETAANCCNDFADSSRFVNLHCEQNQIGHFTKAMKLLEEYYETGVKIDYVQKPFSWALFQTWKYFNAQEKPKKIVEEREENDD